MATTAKSTSEKTATTKAPAKRAKAATPDAIALLMSDHKEVKALFKQYEKLCKADAGADERQAVATEVCMKLTVHAQIEEDIFYPETRAEKTDDMLDEAEVEHASAKDLIAQIEGMSPDDDLYDAKVTVLGEYIDHHVQEEENELFPKVKQLKLDLVEMGARLLARKQELMSEIEVPA